MFCWPRSHGESWAGRATCKQTDRFPHLAAPADCRDSSNKVLGAAAVSQSEITTLLQRCAGTASLFTPQLRAVRSDDTGEKAIHACEGHKRAKVARQQLLHQANSSHVPYGLSEPGSRRAPCHVL